MGPLIPLFWTAGNVFSGFQSWVGFPVCNGFLRFTSGVTPAAFQFSWTVGREYIGQWLYMDLIKLNSSKLDDHTFFCYGASYHQIIFTSLDI